MSFADSPYGDEMQRIRQSDTIQGVALSRAELDEWLTALEGAFWMMPWSRAMLSPILAWLTTLRDAMGEDWISVTILVERSKPAENRGAGS